ncbi:hypothetical protein QUF64_03280 [Anaerolineales bacterium HSG6]|nr:hypothetical protein [Anaerolineales bacterium HSG6]MDM8532066.1 hypothetical protein [Anaerolineales bacterium HSG25]
MIISVIFWSAALASLVAIGFISYALLRLRLTLPIEAQQSLGLSKNLGLEVVWVAFPVVLLLALLVATYQAL